MKGEELKIKRNRKKKDGIQMGGEREKKRSI
jgi:hypothetical protein